MRVRRPGVLIRARDERGAVLMMVAICLLVILGMLVLTFDLGRGVAIKRNMVAGADAAALAAARECGLANGEAAAKQAATDLLVDNNGAATVTGFRIDPGPAQCLGAPNPDPDKNPTVTVTVRVPQEYFFAPIFGINNGTVVASATAEWTLGATNPAPVKLDQLKIEECLEDGIGTDGVVDCYFTFEPNKTLSGAGSDWGWLNVPEGWPIEGQDTNPMNCSSQKGGSKDLTDYIGAMGGMGTPGDPTLLPALWDPTGAGNPPTWVCSSTGHKETSVQAFQDWVDNVKSQMEQGKLESEPVVLFPVVACNGAVAPCHPWVTAPGLAYPVVKLQGFYVRNAWNGPDVKKDAEARANCHFTGPPSRGFCIHLQTTGLDDPSSGGAVTVRLVD
ncbi:MAG: pilus assembly protein TadG-related protein [Actinomycetota bacterium]